MRILKSLVAASLLALPASAQSTEGLDDLYAALKTADERAGQAIAAKIAEELAQSGSPSMDLLLERGRKAMEAADMARAAMHFGAAIDHAPKFAEAYHARATLFFRTERYGLALADLRVVLALNPRHLGALTGMGLLLEELGYEEEALKAWRRLQELYPAHPQAGAAVERLSARLEGEPI